MSDFVLFCFLACDSSEEEILEDTPCPEKFFTHRRLEQEQVCLLAYSHLTPAPNEWSQGDCRY